MRDLTSGTPATRERNWCDGGNARISWARHTSHTYHAYFIVCANPSTKWSPPLRLSSTERTLLEWANCRGTRARGDAPSKSGRFQPPPAEALAFLGLTRAASCGGNHHKQDFFPPGVCTAVLPVQFGSRA
jgi:hypothetical protein